MCREKAGGVESWLGPVYEQKGIIEKVEGGRELGPLGEEGVGGGTKEGAGREKKERTRVARAHAPGRETATSAELPSLGVFIMPKHTKHTHQPPSRPRSLLSRSS